jgi:hypothetical protein
MSKYAKWIAALACAATAMVSLAGCGGSSSQTPVAMSSAERASLTAQLTTIATADQPAIDTCNTNLGDAITGTDSGAGAAAAAACVTAYGKYETDLKAQQWGSVQPLVDDVNGSIDDLMVTLNAIAGAQDGQTFVLLLSDISPGETAVTKKVNALRTALGLPTQ